MLKRNEVNSVTPGVPFKVPGVTEIQTEERGTLRGPPPSLHDLAT